MIEISVLRAGDEAILANVAEGVFDLPVQAHLAAEFLADPRHHLAVAMDNGLVVGAASAVHYLHPDKLPELWINEVGVAATHRRRGLGRDLLLALFEVGRQLGCNEAWVMTERDNGPACRLYGSIGGVQDTGETTMFEFRLGS